MFSTPSDHKLKIMLLGGFKVSLDGRSVDGFAYGKMRALLAYLAVEREQDHSRDVLAELFWSGYEPIAARDNLRRTLSNLRRALELPSGITLFSTSKHTIRFIPDAYIDAMDLIGRIPILPGNQAAAYSNEERIVDLYRGEFLAGLSLPDSPDFEDWLQIQRETLYHRILALLEQLSNHHTQIGDYSKALQFDMRYMELEPWNEDAHRRAIRLYALKGQSSTAIGQYDACCRLLKKELGILPSEKTQQLADRIRNGEFLPESPATVSPSLLHTVPPLPSERRQTTVLYCELALIAIDDPDEAMELLSKPQARCVDIIKRFSGHIVQTHGGGLLAYFGYPQAREDAARRAVLAALAVVREAVHGIEIRAAVHTGLIITGGEPLVPDTVGKESKLAIRLRKSAGYGEVAISQQTHNLVAGYFDCISLDVQSIPDIVQPLEIFKVVSESGARSRLDAATRFTPLTGRKAEIAKLMALWEKAAQGVRHVVLIQGEAGLGKSRLLHTIKQRLADKPHTIRELRCFPEFSQSPFHPLIAMFEAVIGSDHDDTPEVKFGKVVAYVETHYPESRHDAVPMLAQLLSLDLGDHQPSHLSPQKQKELTCAILLATLEALSLKQPVLLVVEDVHWIDSSTLEFLTLLVEKQQGGAIFAAFTARPSFVPPWQEGLMLRLMLAPLSEAAVMEMIASISGDIPPETVRRIVDRADGVPLFVEELAKMVSLDNWASIPATLHDLLAARMDMLGEAKLVAQSAATIGREFDLALLYNIYPHGPVALAQALDTLQAAGLILRVNESTLQFKHALIQEAAYQSQTKSDRQAVHRLIAQVLQTDFSDVVATQPELLAQHLSAGGELRLAIEYWLKAGQRAALKFANLEAIGHFNSGLQDLLLSPGEERDRLEVELLLNLGIALIAAKGYGSVEIGQTYSRALELCEQLGDRVGWFAALWGMWLTSSSRVGHLHSVELGEKLLGMAEQSNDPLQLQLAHHAMGNSLLMSGNPNIARIHLEQSISLYRPSDHEAMVKQYGENICVSNYSLLSWVLWLQGFPVQAEEVGNSALVLARKINHPHSLGYALCASAILNRWMKRLEITRLSAQEAMALSHEHGLPFWQGLGISSYGWVQTMQGEVEGVAQIQQCLDAVDTVMSGAKLLFLAPQCEALVYLEIFDEALDKLDVALAVVDAKDDRFFESELHRLKGECLLGISEKNIEEAEACFNKALIISRKQQAKSLELRAAISMVRLWQQQGKQEDARRLLDEVYSGFTEGFDTLDLQEAVGFVLQE